MKRLTEIFITFFKIGLFTIGGGYAMLPVIQREVVETKGWMTDEEFLDAISLTNSLPGPLAINAATFTGYRVSRAKGAFVAALGAAAPSVIIILLIAMLFSNIAQYPLIQHIFSGIRPAVAALILYSVIRLSRSAGLKDNGNWIIAALAMIAIAFLGIHPVAAIVTAAIYGIFIRDRLAGPGKEEK